MKTELRAAAALALALIAGVGHATAQEVKTHGPSAAASAIVAADRAFAARAAAVGAPRAFGEVMDATDGLAFSPGQDPVRGGLAIQAAQQEALGSGRLAWSPREVFAAKGGDMGVTWGSWSFSPPGATSAAATGRYVTVWRKDALGQWRGLIDLGQSDPRPAR